MAFAAEFGVDVEGVGAVEVDVVVLRWRQVGGGFAGDLGTLTAQRAERIAGVGGRPQHAGVCDQCEAECLVDPVVEVVATNAALPAGPAPAPGAPAGSGPASRRKPSGTVSALIGAKPTWDGGP